jgi:hypothetical protein
MRGVCTLGAKIKVIVLDEGRPILRKRIFHARAKRPSCPQLARAGGRRNPSNGETERTAVWATGRQRLRKELRQLRGAGLRRLREARKRTDNISASAALTRPAELASAFLTLIRDDLHYVDAKSSWRSPAGGCSNRKREDEHAAAYWTARDERLFDEGTDTPFYADRRAYKSSPIVNP